MSDTDTAMKHKTAISIGAALVCGALLLIVGSIVRVIYDARVMARSDTVRANTDTLALAIELYGTDGPTLKQP